MISWVICKNPLRIGFRNEYFTFTSKNEIDLDDLHILKIGFKNSVGIGLGNVSKVLPKVLQQDFALRFCPKFCLRIYPRFGLRFAQMENSITKSDWLFSHYSIPNTKFQTIAV